jgi:hypothetical protein
MAIFSTLLAPIAPPNDINGPSITCKTFAAPFPPFRHRPPWASFPSSRVQNFMYFKRPEIAGTSHQGLERFFCVDLTVEFCRVRDVAKDSAPEMEGESLTQPPYCKQEAIVLHCCRCISIIKLVSYCDGCGHSILNAATAAASFLALEYPRLAGGKSPITIDCLESAGMRAPATFAPQASFRPHRPPSTCHLYLFQPCETPSLPDSSFRHFSHAVTG